MPHEHEMPAPVTMTIFLDLATAKEMSESAFRVLGSPEAASSCSESVMNECGKRLSFEGSSRQLKMGCLLSGDNKTQPKFRVNTVFGSCCCHLFVDVSRRACHVTDASYRAVLNALQVLT
jgi:hypothetical protein